MRHTDALIASAGVSSAGRTLANGARLHHRNYMRPHRASRLDVAQALRRLWQRWRVDAAGGALRVREPLVAGSARLCDAALLDWQLGNFLTRNDKRAEKFGNNRHSQGEGINGHATTRFNLFADDAAYFRTDQVSLDVTMTYIIMHALAMKTRQRRELAALAPSQQLLAA